MFHAALTILATASGHAEETSKTPFYLAGGLLALFAVLVGAVGVVKHDFPSTKGASRAVMAIAAVLVAFAMITAVTSS